MLVLALVLSCLSAGGCGFIRPDSGSSQLHVQLSTVDFGAVAVGTIGWQSVTISNSGTTPLSVAQATVAGTSFTTPSLILPINMAAGQKTSFSVRFAPTAAGNFTGNVSIVSNASNSPATITLNGMGVQVPPLQITTTSVPSTSVTQVYSSTLVATGGVGAFCWSIVSGQFPPGLALSATSGVIAGTPTQAGQFNFTVQVSDSSSPTPKTTTRALSLNVAAPSIQTVTVSQGGTNRAAIQWSSVPNASSYQVLVDDTPNFVTPIVSQTVSQTSLSLNVFDAGFAPGVTYYVRVTPSGSQATFRLNVQPWAESYLSYSYARAAWNSTGRHWMSYYSGIDWSQSTQSWVLNSSWSDASTNLAQDAYYTEYMARSAVNMGFVRNDLALLNELAAFYVAYEGRFTTVGALRAMTQYNTSLLADSGPDSTKTLIWVWGSGSTTYVRECDLCNSQFYHPAARLLRIITTLPSSERTQAMQDFVSWYAPVLTHDHLLRLLWRDNGALIQKYQNSPAYILDLDLWLIAGASEILGANANDPNLVPLTSTEKSQLQQSVQVAVRALQASYRTYYPSTQDFQGTIVGSISYFNGEFISRKDPDYAYSGYTGPTFPTPDDAKVQPTVSWDISHFYRFPVFLRSLYDNIKATGARFPSSDILLVINQLMYKNFQGNFNLPLYNNYFDGSNGWFRAGYDGPNIGYPPSQYCNNSANVGAYIEPCLVSGAVQGWGPLAFFSTDLTQLQHALAALAWSQDPKQIAFRNQYYYYNAVDYSASDPHGQPQYPTLLLWILSGSAEKLQ